MGIVKTLEDMKSILMERGWVRGCVVNYYGNVCLLGAHNLAIYGQSIPDLKQSMWYDTPEYRAMKVEAEVRGYDLPQHFNDTNLRTFNEIIDFLDTIILAEKERLSE